MSDSEQPPCPENDALVVAARTDRMAFGQLYEAYYERILGYCSRRLAQRDVAEDVCGNTFLFVARKMSTFPGETAQDFRRWVYRIATNEVNAYLRQTLRRRRLWDDALQQQRLQASSLTVESGSSDSLEWPVVYEAISRLTSKEQTIVTLRLFEEMQHEEIAQVLDVRPGTVRVTYSRAIKKLREWLSRHVSQTGESLTRRE